MNKLVKLQITLQYSENCKSLLVKFKLSYPFSYFTGEMRKNEFGWGERRSKFKSRMWLLSRFGYKKVNTSISTHIYNYWTLTVILYSNRKWGRREHVLQKLIAEEKNSLQETKFFTWVHFLGQLLKWVWWLWGRSNGFSLCLISDVLYDHEFSNNLKLRKWTKASF